MPGGFGGRYKPQDLVEEQPSLGKGMLLDCDHGLIKRVCIRSAERRRKQLDTKDTQQLSSEEKGLISKCGKAAVKGDPG
jgi:hypothetical protein